MMNKQPPSLVDALAEQNPVLFATYKKTEEVAINHWYPGMSQSNGSVNSYPHVQGIINQLSLVIYHPQCAITLTDVELYLLLTSILLHDIGKVKQAKDHGKESRNIIREQWAVLKIENEQMQQIIQNICYLHDRKEKEFELVYQTLPADEYIDRYGKVRPRLLGALLYLGDHMDNSYTRTISEKFTSHFRKSVLGVHFQPEQQMITTVIHPGAFIHKIESNQTPTFNLSFVKTVLGSMGNYLEAEINNHPSEDSSQMYIDVLALQHLMYDTYLNNSSLNQILNELYMLGMPIKKWMIECEGHLFLINKVDETSTTEIVSDETLKTIISILEDSDDRQPEPTP